MKTPGEVVFLLLCFFLITISVHSTNYLIHTVEYKLDAKKSFSMHTVSLHDDVLPVMIVLEPQIKISEDKTTIKRDVFTTTQDIKKQEQDIKQQIKKEKRREFHQNLKTPIRIAIHDNDATLKECIFDQPWDMCVLPKTKKNLQFSIHCMLEQGQKDSQSCKGKAKIRQAQITRIDQNSSKYHYKTKYESGLFKLPLSQKHSLMLFSCQDDDLPQDFSSSLTIFSTLKYHRYEREDEEQTKDIVGFNAGINDNNKKTYVDEQFMYLDVEDVMVKKCLQFQFYKENKLFNGRQVFDYVNLTDTTYKNTFTVAKPDESKSNQPEIKPNIPSETAQPQLSVPKKQPAFKYNAQVTLNVFKPSKISESQAYDIRIKVIDSAKQSTVISYTLPLAINKESSQKSISLYAKSNHYHFVYVIGNQVIKDLQNIEIQVEFQARRLEGQQQKNTQMNQFFFISLSVEDTQNIVVEKLTTSYVSIKKGEHITFLIEEPYDVEEIKTQQNQQQSDVVNIQTSSEKLMLKMSEHSADHQHVKQCHFSKGCKFQVDASADCLDCMIQYKPAFIKSPNDLLSFEIKKQMLEGKIDLDQVQYFYKYLQPNQLIEFVVNTPNIIVYTLQNQKDLSRCKIPKKSCHSQIATSHEKILIFNQNTQNTQLVYFAIEGLDKTHFTVLLLASNRLVNVMNGMPFTYKLPAEKDEITMLFDVPSFDPEKQYEEGVTFNLVAPYNSLEMTIVQLGQDDSEIETVQKKKTIQGYVKLSGKEIKGHHLKITISKTLHYLNHPVHFTFIASTSDHKYRLDTGITHYQTFDSAQQKTFIIEFQDSHEYELNLHFYDTQEDEISFSVAVYNPEELDDEENSDEEENQLGNFINYQIKSSEFTIFLDQTLIEDSGLCPENDPQCTVYIMISSMMKHEVEVSMTLLSSDSVLQLKDGVWQTFRADSLLLRSHFYFIPTHLNHTVKIFFKSSNPQLYLSALLYDNRENVNPGEWPFPLTHGHGKEQNLYKYDEKQMFKSNHLILVDNEDPEFKKCFPHCVVLLSILDSTQQQKGQKKNEKAEDDRKVDKLSILASNSQIQLPERMRLNLQLKEQQEQLIFIDLKHAFKENKQLLTFFTNQAVGYAQVYAKVYLPSLQNIPDKQDYDFKLDSIKTQISLNEIKEIFTQEISWQSEVVSVEQALQSEELFLVLLIVAEENSIISLEYTTDYKEIRELEIDSVQTVFLDEGEQRLFQFVPIKDERIRFIRNKGYPLFHQFKCSANQGEGYDKCLKIWLEKLKIKTQDDIRNIKKQESVQKQLIDSPLLTDKKLTEMAELSTQEYFTQSQILKRTQTQHVLQCQHCIVFIWIYALEQSQLTIQLQSLNTQTPLKQGELLAEYVQPSDYHRYIVPRVQKQFTNIVVTVNQGNPLVEVKDNLNFAQIKKGSQVKQAGRKVLVFTAPPASASGKSRPEQGSGPKRTSFNQLFSNLHVSITPQDLKPVSYSITYSSGSNEMFLQNGVISSHFLFNNEKTIFFYQREKNEKQKTYLTLTVQAPKDLLQTILKGIEIKFYSLVMQKETQQILRNQLLSEVPNLGTKAFKKQTTLTYELPPFQNIEIEITSKETTKITIGISNGKLVFLPLDYEYPIQLKPKEQIRFVIQSFSQGDVQLVVKKCDQSNPSIFYTNDQTQFGHDVFANYDKMGSENVFRHVSRTKEKGTLYVKIKADPKESSLLMITSNYIMTPGDLSFMDLDPGNMGIINYQFQSLEEIQVSFSGLECKEECEGVTDYYLVRSKSLPKIYSQLVCAGQEVIQLFEEKKSVTKLTGEKKQSKSLLEPLKQQILIEKLTQKPDQMTNEISLNIPINLQYPYMTIKAVYNPTGQQIFYKPTEIRTLKQSLNKNYSSNLLLIFIFVILIALAILVLITQKISRKGYVHVGQDQTMIA